MARTISREKRLTLIGISVSPQGVHQCLACEARSEAKGLMSPGTGHKGVWWACELGCNNDAAINHPEAFGVRRRS